MKKKVLLCILISTLSLLIFVFFAAKPTGKQTFFKPQSVSEIKIVSSKINQDTDIFPFISSQYFGYYDKEGKILFSQKKQNNFSLTKNFWTAYEIINTKKNASSEELETSEVKIMSPTGKALFSVPLNGYVHLRNNRCFVLLYSGNTVCEYDSEGKFLWSYSMPGIITAFDCNNEFVVIGSSDGAIALVDKTGTEKFVFYPGGSDVQIICGLSISNDGKKIGCLCGLKKQRLLLIEANDYHKIIFHIFLEKNLKKQAVMFFDNNSNYLVSETAEGVVILNCKNFDFTKTEVQGEITSNYIETADEVFGILTKKSKSATLTFFDFKCRKVAQTEFECSTCSMSQIQNNFYLILDDELLKFSLDKQ